jgi:hypothetical protein
MGIQRVMGKVTVLRRIDIPPNTIATQKDMAILIRGINPNINYVRKAQEDETNQRIQNSVKKHVGRVEMALAVY